MHYQIELKSNKTLKKDLLKNITLSNENRK